MQNERGTVIFTHIPKTAGISMNFILRRQYQLKRGTIFYADNIQHVEALKSLPEKFKSKLILVYSHLYFGVHKYLPQPAQYFTMLRDPVKRTISMYNFLYVWPKTPFYKTLTEKQYSIADLYDNGLVLNMDNCHVRFLCGVDDIPFGEVNDTHLEQALGNLENYYKGGVGITERFDESILLLAKRFRWSTPWYTRQNANDKERVKLSDLDATTLEKLKYYNRFDDILYKRALELFDEQVAAAGPGFKEEVAAFKKENENRRFRTRVMNKIFAYLFELKFYTGSQKRAYSKTKADQTEP